MPRKNTPEDFWQRVDKSGDCWLWTGAISNGTYGKTNFAGKQYGAHQLAWILTNGEIPQGLFVCHKCDNPRCVNPDHLWLDTPKNNTHDMIRKARKSNVRPAPQRGDNHWSRKHPEWVRRGVKHHKAKLTEEQVKLVRSKVAQGQTMLSVARDFNVHVSLVSLIVKRKIWTHVE